MTGEARLKRRRLDSENRGELVDGGVGPTWDDVAAATDFATISSHFFLRPTSSSS